MTRALAILWLAVVAVAAGYLTLRVYDGLTFRTDLLALIPHEARDPVLQQANEQVADVVSRRVLLLVGHAERDQARAAAQSIAAALTETKQMTLESTGFDQDRLRRIGQFYFPYRRGLLAAEDRARLQNGGEQEIATRALSQVFGVLGMVDGKLLQSDPFLLFPAFLTSLPLPLSRLTLDGGLLSVRENGTTWILVAGRLNESPYALDTQARLAETLRPVLQAQVQPYAGVSLLRLGAVFFAEAGAGQALHESSVIGTISLIGTILLIVLVFRALTPLWLNLLAMGVGIGTALSASLWLFGELHVMALLFGVGLIGIAVDYSLQYFSEIFASDSATPAIRLRRVLPGMTLGMLSVLVGYLTLFLAPFPGLHQIAAFSAIGLIASWTTVVLWLPLLDRAKPARHGSAMLAAAAAFWAFWTESHYRHPRHVVMACLLVLALVGLFRLHADDDVRRMQSLDAQLLAEQARIQQLIGSGFATQYILVQAADEETALQHEEALVSRLQPLVASGTLGGFQTLAQYVPSAARQQDNRALRQRLDETLLATHAAQLGLPMSAQTADDEKLLTPEDASKEAALSAFVSLLRLAESSGPVTHIVTLEGIADLAALTHATDGLPGVRLVDPAGEFSALLGKYRIRAVAMLGVSLLLMTPLLLWRYGLRRGPLVLLPPALAILLTPVLRALSGDGFTFFDAMGLVLVLSVGVDYAIFVAETTPDRKAVTVVAVTLAALSTLLSFGMLAWSEARAVHAFGATMLIGVSLALLLVPLAAAGNRSR